MSISYKKKERNHYADQSTQFCGSDWLECQKIFTPFINGKLFEITVYNQKKTAEAVYRLFLQSKGNAASVGSESGDGQSL